MRPTIILATPYLYGLDQCIEENLRFHGYDVINLCFDDRDVHYPHFFSRLKNLYYKNILHDGDYRKQLRFLPYRSIIEQKLATLGSRKAEYALCIRANIYPKSLIEKIRAHSEICVNYQWDGIDRFPDILQYLEYFDRFFVFDQQDVQRYPQYHFQTTSNFYFDFPMAEDHTDQTDGLYFLGGYDPTRSSDIQSFLAQARRLKLPLDFHIYSKDDRARHTFGNDGIQYLNRDTVLSFKTNLQKVRNCSVVIDFITADHQGLSFRVFDAMHYRKKLITTNHHIQDYDFYHSDNILIWQHTSDQQLIDFLQKPYQALPPDIEQKYSFNNWIHYLLDIKPHQPITLPHTIAKYDLP